MKQFIYWTKELRKLAENELNKLFMVSSSKKNSKKEFDSTTRVTFLLGCSNSGKSVFIKHLISMHKPESQLGIHMYQYSHIAGFKGTIVKNIDKSEKINATIVQGMENALTGLSISSGIFGIPLAPFSSFATSLIKKKSRYLMIFDDFGENDTYDEEIIRFIDNNKKHPNMKFLIIGNCGRRKIDNLKVKNMMTQKEFKFYQMPKIDIEFLNTFQEGNSIGEKFRCDIIYMIQKISLPKKEFISLTNGSFGTIKFILENQHNNFNAESFHRIFLETAISKIKTLESIVTSDEKKFIVLDYYLQNYPIEIKESDFYNYPEMHRELVTSIFGFLHEEKYLETTDEETITISKFYKENDYTISDKEIVNSFAKSLLEILKKKLPERFDLRLEVASKGKLYNESKALLILVNLQKQIKKSDENNVDKLTQKFLEINNYLLLDKRQHVKAILDKITINNACYDYRIKAEIFINRLIIMDKIGDYSNIKSNLLEGVALYKEIACMNESDIQIRLGLVIASRAMNHQVDIGKNIQEILIEIERKISKYLSENKNSLHYFRYLINFTRISNIEKKEENQIISISSILERFNSETDSKYYDFERFKLLSNRLGLSFYIEKIDESKIEEDIITLEKEIKDMPNNVLNFKKVKVINNVILANYLSGKTTTEESIEAILDNCYKGKCISEAILFEQNEDNLNTHIIVLLNLSTLLLYCGKKDLAYIGYDLVKRLASPNDDFYREYINFNKRIYESVTSGKLNKYTIKIPKLYQQQNIYRYINERLEFLENYLETHGCISSLDIYESFLKKGNYNNHPLINSRALLFCDIQYWE